MFVEKILSKILNISKFPLFFGVVLFMSQDSFANPSRKPAPIRNKKQEETIHERASVVAILKHSGSKPEAIRAERSLKPKQKPGWPE